APRPIFTLAGRPLFSTTRSMPPPLCGRSFFSMRRTLIAIGPQADAGGGSCPESDRNCPSPHISDNRHLRDEGEQGGGDEADGEGEALESVHVYSPWETTPVPLPQHEPCQARRVAEIRHFRRLRRAAARRQASADGHW